MPLSPAQRRHLRALCHALKPVVTVAERGLAPSVSQEIEQALAHHELIKIRLAGADRAQKAQLTEALLAACGAELVQSIGHVVSIYRHNPDKPRIELPR